MRIRRFHIRGRDLPSPLVGGYTIGNSGGDFSRIEQLERALCRSSRLADVGVPKPWRERPSVWAADSDM